MARIVFLTVGITSHVNAYSRIAEQLVERGHEVAFLSPRDEVRETVESRGFPFFSLEDEQALLKFTEKRSQPGINLPLVRWLYRVPVVSSLMPYLAVRTRRRQARALYEHITTSNELERVLEKLRPDLLLIAYELAHHVIRSMALSVPVALLQTHISTRQAPNVPILDSVYIPTDEPESPRRAAATWRRVYLRRRLRFGLERLYLGGQDVMSALKELARRTGLDFEREIEYLNQWAFLHFSHAPTLYLSAREIDFPQPTGDQCDYVGPQVMTGRPEPGNASQNQSAILDVMQQAREQGRPLLYCAMGTWRGNHETDLLNRIAEAVADRPDWNLLISLGGNLEPSELAPLPDNVYAFANVPQLLILEQASIAITHGGIATINECILAGVPMLIYSNGFLDRNGNAARVVFHGLGLRGDARSDKPEKIAQNIQRLLSDETYRDKLDVMARHFRAYEQKHAVVSAIEKLLSSAAENPKTLTEAQPLSSRD